MIHEEGLGVAGKDDNNILHVSKYNNNLTSSNF